MDPLERPVEAVAADLSDGYVSLDAARRDYRVVVTEQGAVDLAATEVFRSDPLVGA